MIEKINTIKELIGKDKTNEAIKLIKDITEEEDLKSKIILLEGRLERLSRESLEGTIHRYEIDTTKNQINKTILDILLKITNKNNNQGNNSFELDFIEQKNTLVDLLNFRFQCIVFSMEEYNRMNNCLEIPYDVLEKFKWLHDKNIKAINGSNLVLSHDITNQIHRLLRNCILDQCLYSDGGSPIPIVQFGRTYLHFTSDKTISLDAINSIDEIFDLSISNLDPPYNSLNTLA